MCHPRVQGSAANAECSCDCACPIILSIDDEIRMLESHRKMMQERISAIDEKIMALKAVRPS